MNKMGYFVGYWIASIFTYGFTLHLGYMNSSRSFYLRLILYLFLVFPDGTSHSHYCKEEVDSSSTDPTREPFRRAGQ